MQVLGNLPNFLSIYITVNSQLFISSFNDGMNVRALPITGSNTVLKKPVSESILSINATLPMGKVMFLCIIPSWEA